MKRFIGAVALAVLLGGCATGVRSDVTDTVGYNALVRHCENLASLETPAPDWGYPNGTSDVASDLSRAIYYRCLKSGR